MVGVEEQRLAALREALRACEERAERAIRVRDDFLLVASHELRTPCTSLTLAIQGLLRHACVAGCPDEHLGLMLGACDRQIRHLNQLVDRLLDVARMQSGDLRLDLETVDLAALARSTVHSMSEVAARARCPLELRGAEQPIVGTWDRARLGQLVADLVGNALKYGAGRPVSVDVEATPSMARLSVRDAGIGIAARDLDRVFEPFQRAVAAKEFGGLGLGLYIAREIAGAHGGSIRADSAPGEGSTFVTDLPRSPARSAP